MRKNQMIMMEEFRRRKNLKDYYEMMHEQERKAGKAQKIEEIKPFDVHPDSVNSFEQYKGSGEERFFEP